jgi:hypothetical protein
MAVHTHLSVRNLTASRISRASLVSISNLNYQDMHVSWYLTMIVTSQTEQCALSPCLRETRGVLDNAVVECRCGTVLGMPGRTCMLQLL